MVKEAIIHLENGKSLTITVQNQGKDNIYVNKVSVNGKIIEGILLSHNDIINGGEILFEMQNTPKDNE